MKKIGLYLGNIHGYYDRPTRAAVLALQQAKKITADGVVGPVTFHQLRLSNAVAAPLPLGIS
ncbi:MAG: peptidoglycan-binding protein [Firmicutes bacterium]|nr:peptidoglycan-binding protein [Bacillota bacterium]MCL5063512.1 peptidoglycan-binding protein [Bacillota bacterium]